METQNGARRPEEKLRNHYKLYLFVILQGSKLFEFFYNDHGNIFSGKNDWTIFSIYNTFKQIWSNLTNNVKNNPFMTYFKSK